VPAKRRLEVDEEIDKLLGLLSHVTLVSDVDGAYFNLLEICPAD
jgi:hypothetical protein